MLTKQIAKDRQIILSTNTMKMDVKQIQIEVKAKAQEDLMRAKDLVFLKPQRPLRKVQVLNDESIFVDNIFNKS